MIKGQDWSSFQPETPSTSGISFAFVKSTEGTTYVNPRQNAQSAHARAAGLVVGFYHFLHPGSITEQAQYFVDKCASESGDLLACDWESTTSGSASSAEKDVFLTEVKRLRPQHRVLLYCNVDFWINHDTTGAAGDGLWIADYVTAGKPNVQHPWVIHQYAGSPTDQDVANFDTLSDFRSWAAIAPVPTPTPVDTKPWVWLDGPWVETIATNSTKIVQMALAKEVGLNYSSGPGRFGPKTRAAYALWQRRYSDSNSLGWSLADCNGAPGKTSLTALGKKYGFDVRMV
jgi:hypothetical protein